MTQIEYITIKNASRKVLNRMRKIGQEKAQRLQKVQERWDAGEYDNIEVVQLQMMEDIVRIFRSSDGDVYHITLSEDKGVLSAQALDALGEVTVIGIELRRLAGNHTTGLEVLAAVEDSIAKVFLQRKDVIICYYCDFINRIPHTSKNSMPPQEYRSLLFDKLFQRYTHQHQIKDVRLSVVEINGINEKYYFHVIYRENHSILASLIGHDLKEGFDK